MPSSPNRTTSIVKSPKLYFADTGVLCALLNVRSAETLAGTPSVGALTFVRGVLGARAVGGGGVVCRASTAVPLTDGFRTVPIADFGT